MDEGGGVRMRGGAELAAVAELVATAIRSAAAARAREDEASARLDALAARMAERADARCRGAAERLEAARGRCREGREAALRRHGFAPETGWEHDPVAMEAIRRVALSDLPDAAAISAARRAVGALLHPDRTGPGYEALLAWANDFLDRTARANGAARRNDGDAEGDEAASEEPDPGATPAG